MVSVAVSKTGKTQVHFIDKGTKVDGRCYRETLLQNCLDPARHPSAVCRGVRVSAGWRSVAPGEVNGRVSAAERTQHHRAFCLSPDINPVDYAVWGALRQDVYRVPIVGLEDLKDRVRTCWVSLDQQLINKAIDQWRPRLKTVAKVHGVEQLFT